MRLGRLLWCGLFFVPLFVQEVLGSSASSSGVVLIPLMFGAAAGTWATKAWPPSHAARCIRRLIAADLPVLLIAGPGEEAVTGTLSALVPELRVLPPAGVAALVGVIARLRALFGTKELTRV